MVTGKTEPKTAERWISIISMEVAIQVGSGLIYFVTLLVQSYRIAGIVGILWFSILCNVGNFVMICFLFENDAPEDAQSIPNTIKGYVSKQKVQKQIILACRVR